MNLKGDSLVVGGGSESPLSASRGSGIRFRWHRGNKSKSSGCGFAHFGQLLYKPQLWEIMSITRL